MDLSISVQAELFSCPVLGRTLIGPATARRLNLSTIPIRQDRRATFQYFRPHHNVNLAAIQRRGSILSWSVILSFYGAVTIAIDLSLSAQISGFAKSIIGFLNNSNLHAINY
jgi:hypothetical protein